MIQNLSEQEKFFLLPLLARSECKSLVENVILWLVYRCWCCGGSPGIIAILCAVSIEGSVMHGDSSGVRYPGLVGGGCPFWGIRHHTCMHFMNACEAEKRRGPGGVGRRGGVGGR